MNVLPFCDERDDAETEEHCTCVEYCLAHGPDSDHDVVACDRADDAVCEVAQDRECGKDECRHDVHRHVECREITVEHLVDQVFSVLLEDLEVTSCPAHTLSYGLL